MTDGRPSRLDALVLLLCSLLNSWGGVRQCRPVTDGRPSRLDALVLLLCSLKASLVDTHIYIHCRLNVGRLYSRLDVVYYGSFNLGRLDLLFALVVRN